MKSERRRGKFWKGKALIFAVLFATLAFVSIGCASAATHYVNPSESAAVNTASDGNIICSPTKSIAPEEEWNRTFGGIQSDEGHSVAQTSDGGYIIAGSTESYGAGSEDVWLIKADSSGNKVWDKTFGGSYSDRGKSVAQTFDGGYIVAGYTNSYGAGGYDGWLIKTDSSGNEEWNKTLGGTGADRAYSVQQTTDSGYIIAGCTNSYSDGEYDFWLVKTDSNGNEEWNKRFGGTSHDYAYSVQQTSDGGYIIAGATLSYGNPGVADFWFVKTDSNGNWQWDKAFGGSKPDMAYSVQQTSDGGYIVTGYTESYGTWHGTTVLPDLWLIKTDSNGNRQWDKTFGGAGVDYAYSVRQPSNGGYIIAGYTKPYGAEYYDVWLVRTDSGGNEVWNKTFGETGDDRAYSVQQTSDGGYIVAGSTTSYGTCSEDVWLIKIAGEEVVTPPVGFTYGGIADDWGGSVAQTSDGGYIITGGTRSYGVGSYDVWLIKTDSNSNKIWDKTFGGTDADAGLSIVLTSDGGYIVVGYTQSYGAGGDDVWLIKTDSNGNKIWDKTYGGTGWDMGQSAAQTSDGGYIVVGTTYLYGAGEGDVWLIKTDSNGNEIWNKTYGGTDWDEGLSIVKISDGGYIILGRTDSYGAGWLDAWLIKTDSNGNEIWNKTYGGTDDDWGYSVAKTTDGGYVVAGHTYSYGAGDDDVWLTKTDSNGNEIWNKTYGGTDWDGGYSVAKTTDGGYIVAGSTQSDGNGSADVWLIKTDSNGNEIWDKTYGGTDWDGGVSIAQTSDSGYIVAGSTTSYGAGSEDIWLIKIGGETNQPPTAIIDSITPDPAEQGTDTVSFTGHGTDSDGSVVAYNWRSSIDGQLSTSSSFTKPASELSVGTHTIYFKVQDNDGAWSPEDTEDLTINAPEPEISYSPTSHNFGDKCEGETDSTTFEIWNSGSGTLTYSLSESCDWVDVHPTSGSSTGEHDTITVDINTTGLSEGSHSCDISISSNGGSGTFTVTVNVIPCEPILCTNPDPPSHGFGSVPEGQTRTWTFNITNCGAGTLTWTVSDDRTWITVNPPSGSTTTETDTVTVTIDTTGLANTTHTGTITVNSNDGTKTGTITVDVEELLNFDTGSPENPYPSIFGTHNGTIKPNQTITVSKLYTYPCPGTGGHTEYAKIWNNSDWNVTARWEGYSGDWHNISFDNFFTLEEGETYNYTIKTGSYPQIHHTDNRSTPAGFITCSEFIDANEKRYDDWIPAIKLE